MPLHQVTRWGIAKMLVEKAEADPMQRRIKTLHSENARLRKSLNGAITALQKRKKQARELRRASRAAK